ncbi:MAG: nucleoside-diphosphate-sugar epimerase [Gemmatimonadetes bacterium]|nr:nucleoside-diphosphate-sugar epimerase [Gemmatimonadota bacterium]
MARALVTGATGLVGSHIVDQLLRDGWDVRALVRTPNPELEARGVETARGDVLDADSFARAAAGRDVVFHTAAAITPSGGWEAYRGLNVDGTSNAIAAAERAGARLLQLSSVAVYGPTGRYRAVAGKTDELAPPGPLPEKAYYARSKRESEQLVMDAHAQGRIWATAVRPDVIYGNRDRQFVPRIARLLQRGVAPVIGGGRSTLAIVHAANVADGAIRAAMHDGAGGRAYNLANDFDVTVRDFFKLGAQGLGRSLRLISVPLPLANALFRAAMATLNVVTGGTSSVLSTASLSMVTRDNPFTSDRARRELGWAPAVRPEQSIPEAFRWWLRHH